MSLGIVPDKPLSCSTRYCRLASDDREGGSGPGRKFAFMPVTRDWLLHKTPVQVEPLPAQIGPVSGTPYVQDQPWLGAVETWLAQLHSVSVCSTAVYCNMPHK